MIWFNWLRRGSTRAAARADGWRKAWAEAVAGGEPAQARDLRQRLDAMASSGHERDDFEIEREMLDGLDALIELAAQVRTGGLPLVPTGHRAVGADRCHFAAPASLPDDHAQASGTLLLTSTRAIVVGGGRALTIPWHDVRSLARDDRDLILARAGQPPHRIRCNTFADALRAAFLADQLTRGRRV